MALAVQHWMFWYYIQTLGCFGCCDTTKLLRLISCRMKILTVLTSLYTIQFVQQHRPTYKNLPKI